MNQMVELADYIIGCSYPLVGSNELQVKRPIILGHFYPFVFAVYLDRPPKKMLK